MKIMFMGTPDFAVCALQALLEAGHEITVVVTQPDKPKGRSGKLQAPPVKELAMAHNIPVLQPERIKRPEAIEELRRFEADVYIVAAFGQILSREILDIPPYGCLNIHASLLPKYRGSSPIQHVILNGEEETGITIQQMDVGVDTGDIMYCKTIPITQEDTFETLHDKLKILGGEAVTEALSLLEEGKLTPQKQDEAASSHAPLIDKQMGLIDFGRDAVQLNRLVRGLNPWPSAYTFYHGKQLKIWCAVPGADSGVRHQAVPGTVLAVTKDAIEVACGRGTLHIRNLQLEGRKRMSTHDFLLGVKVEPGEILGE